MLIARLCPALLSSPAASAHSTLQSQRQHWLLRTHASMPCFCHLGQGCQDSGWLSLSWHHYVGQHHQSHHHAQHMIGLTKAASVLASGQFRSGPACAWEGVGSGGSLRTTQLYSCKGPGRTTLCMRIPASAPAALCNLGCECRSHHTLGLSPNSLS